MFRTQPITKRSKFLQQPMSNCYIGYMVNNNNISATDLDPYLIVKWLVSVNLLDPANSVDRSTLG